MYSNFKTSLDGWRKKINDNSCPPVTIIQCKAAYFDHLVVDALKKSSFKIEWVDDSTARELVVSLALQGSIFSEQVLIAVKRCNSSMLKHIIESYSRHPFANPIVCFCTGNEARSASLSKKPWIFHLKQPAFRTFEMRQVIHDIAARMQIRISDDVASYLAESQQSLSLIANEFQRLTLSETSRKTVLSLENAHNHFGMVPSPEVFRIDRALVRGAYPEVVAVAHRLISDGESPIALLGVIARHCRNFLRIRLFVKHGNSPSDCAKKLGIPPSVVSQYNSLIKSVPANAYVALLKQCSAVDVALKSSRVSADLLISGIIAKLADIPVAEKS